MHGFLLNDNDININFGWIMGSFREMKMIETSSWNLFI